MFTLYGHRGWGSVLIEAQFAWYGTPFEFVDVGNLFKQPEARGRLVDVNPLAQVPTLVLPDGSIMTESAAITLFLADSAPAGRALVPSPGDPARPAFLRWLVFLVANVYPTFTYIDVPDRFVADPTGVKELTARVSAYRDTLWRQVETAVGAPWFLGARFSALDIYLGVMTRWTPKRGWFEANTPKIHAAAAAVDRVPELSPVWERNYRG